jgi:hypothetical protein
MLPVRQTTIAALISLSTVFAACAADGEGMTSSADELTRGAADQADGPPERRECTANFGSGLTNGWYGRLDGILVAVVSPNAFRCQSDRHHVHLQIAMQGSTYDVAVNVDEVDFGQQDAPLTGAPWSEGWHPGGALDYPTNLGIHASDFTALDPSELTTAVENALAQANHISVYATRYGSGGVHLVHRTKGRIGTDGAIVLNPLSANAHYLAFHFPTQTF